MISLQRAQLIGEVEMADNKPTPPLARPTRADFTPVDFDYGLNKRVAKHSKNYKRDELAKHVEFNEHDPQEEG
jgi:hypothetical protein